MMLFGDNLDLYFASQGFLRLKCANRQVTLCWFLKAHVHLKGHGRVNEMIGIFFVNQQKLCTFIIYVYSVKSIVSLYIFSFWYLHHLNWWFNPIMYQRQLLYDLTRYSIIFGSLSFIWNSNFRFVPLIQTIVYTIELYFWPKALDLHVINWVCRIYNCFT